MDEGSATGGGDYVVDGSSPSNDEQQQQEQQPHPSVASQQSSQQPPPSGNGPMTTMMMTTTTTTAEGSIGSSSHHGGEDSIYEISSSTYLFAFCASVNSCNLGYDIGVSTSAAKMMEEQLHLTYTQREIFIGSINFWGMFGAIMAQYFSDQYGRRRTFLFAAILFIIGVIIQSISSSYTMLLMGRLFVGLGVGSGLAIDPLYISEVSPAKFRGELVTWSEMALNMGIVFGFSTGLILAPMNDHIEWRIMFLLGGILPIVMIIFVFTIMPETPRWLVANNRIDDARIALQLIYPPGYNVDVIIKDIQHSIDCERTTEQSITWNSLLFHSTPAIRRMLLVGVSIAIAQQAVGIDAIQYYLLDVLHHSGISSNTKQTLVLIFLGLLKLFFIIVGGKLFDKIGRRPLFFTSLLGMAFALFILGAGFVLSSSEDSVSGGYIVVGLALYLSFFSIGMGPGAWLIPSEIFSSCIRAKAMSIATIFNRLTSTIMSSTFLSASNAMGWGGFFLLLCFICLFFFAFIYIYLPETSNKTLEDMSIYFAQITNDTSILETEARLRDNISNGSNSASGGIGGIGDGDGTKIELPSTTTSSNQGSVIAGDHHVDAEVL